MPTRPIANDALWRCLCPSFSPPGLAHRSFVRRQPQQQLARRCGSAQRSTLSTPARHYTYTAVDRRDPPNAATPGLPYRSNSALGHSASLRQQAKDGASPLVLLPTLELYERLRIDAAAGRHDDVMNIIRILIRDRRERPNVRLYAALLHSFVNTEKGTAGKIRKVLDEMAEAGVDLDAGGCHAVLEALAVHPDYLLREEVLTYMKERWFTLSDRAHNMVAAGLLRDRLFEQAIQKIDDMTHQRIKVADWLLDKAIWILLDYGEVDEAWQLLLVRRQSGRTGLSQPLCGHFLDVAARLHHVESATNIWTTRVIPGYLKPPTATCLHVLNLAARSGNVNLATDVFRVLAERDTVLTSYHYESLLEAFLNTNDLDAAISVALIMNESGIKVTEASIHPLYMFLRQNEKRPMEAFSMLQNSESAGKKVPTACVNACLQACVHLNRLSEAIEIYKALHSVSRAGPNTQTYNILFQGCHKAGRKELAMFLAAEMLKLGIAPDALTYDRLVLVCCQSDDLHDAFLYYEEMRARKFVPRRGTFEVLVEWGVNKGDGRAWKVLQDMTSCGYMPARRLVIAVKERFAEVGEMGGGADGGRVNGERMGSENVNMEHVDMENSAAAKPSTESMAAGFAESGGDAVWTAVLEEQAQKSAIRDMDR